MKKTNLFKIGAGFVLCLCLMLVSNTASAEEEVASADSVQPAEQSRYIIDHASYMDITTSVHATEGAYFPWVSVGTQGEGGVTFFNGTIINQTTDPESGAQLPVTFGDDVRIDGTFWRDQKGDAADNRPLIAADSLVPGLDNMNRLGYSSLQWSEVWTHNLRGNENVHENNLSVTNNPTTGHLLSAAGSNEFTWISIGDAISTAITEGDTITSTHTEVTMGGDDLDGGTFSSVILAGRTRIEPDALYSTADRQRVELAPYGTTFDSAEDYYVLATYENNNAPNTDQQNLRWPLVIHKIDGDTFDIYHQMPQDTNAEDPIVMWQVIGH